MNCTCNASHEGHCDAASAQAKRSLYAQQLAGLNVQLANPAQANQHAGYLTNPAISMVDKETEPSVRDELVKTAREFIRRGRANSGSGSADISQAIALLDCAMRIGGAL